VGTGGGALEVRAESPKVKRGVSAEFGPIQGEQESYALDDPSGQKGYFSHARQIQRVEIRNLKVIEELDLVLDLGAVASAESGLGAESVRRAPWLMLLGENGLGKSTVLQAVCLALLDERTREGLGLNAADFVRNGTRRASGEGASHRRIGADRARRTSRLPAVTLREGVRWGTVRRPLPPHAVVLETHRLPRCLRLPKCPQRVAKARWLGVRMTHGPTVGHGGTRSVSVLRVVAHAAFRRQATTS
jgi:hypothetical protein